MDQKHVSVSLPLSEHTDANGGSLSSSWWGASVGESSRDPLGSTLTGTEGTLDLGSTLTGTEGTLDLGLSLTGGTGVLDLLGKSEEEAKILGEQTL